jgi:hypothetical protein
MGHFYFLLILNLKKIGVPLSGGQVYYSYHSVTHFSFSGDCLFQADILMTGSFLHDFGMEVL